MSDPEPEPLLEFREVMRRLRAECPWKREQTHRSLARYLLEETHEALEAIDTGEQLSAAEVDARWQEIKQRTAPRRTPTDGLPDTLPALLHAAKAVERGLAVPAPADDLGDRLLALVGEAVTAGVDPEQALRDAVRRQGQRSR